jgi:hypothetical protein
VEYAEDRVGARSSIGIRGATWDRWVCHQEANTDPDKHRRGSQQEDRLEHAAMLCLGQHPEAPLEYAADPPDDAPAIYAQPTPACSHLSDHRDRPRDITRQPSTAAPPADPGSRDERRDQLMPNYSLRREAGSDNDSASLTALSWPQPAPHSHLQPRTGRTGATLGLTAASPFVECCIRKVRV